MDRNSQDQNGLPQSLDPALCIVRQRDGDGVVRGTWLGLLATGQLAMVQDSQAEGFIAPELLPAGALRAVFARYGKPLEEDVKVPDEAEALLVPSSTEGDLLRLRPLRFRPYGWAVPLDYLVLDTSSGKAEALCLPAPLLGAALLHLARSWRGRSDVGPAK